MNVSLTPKLEQFVNRKLASGRYQTGSEVVRDGLRLLEEQDQLRQARLKQLQAELKVGLSDLKAGRYRTYDKSGLEKLATEVKDRGRKRLTRVGK